MASRALVERLTREVAEAADQFVPGLEGACLGTSAVLAVVLRRAGVRTDAVRGEYHGEAHWWLESAEYRIDPTRRQFEAKPEVELLVEDDLRNEVPYVPETRVSARWTEEQAVLEFARMFVYRDVGMRNARAVLKEVIQNA